jgi:hypothetical protein
MKTSKLGILSLCGLCLLIDCGGGGGGTPPPPPAATHFTVTAPAMATAGTAFMITVTARDAANNVVTNYSGTVQLTSTDGQAALLASSTLASGNSGFQVTLKTVGSQTIFATDSVSTSIMGTSNSINVAAASASHLTLATQGIATAGTPFNLTVTAFDAFSNTAVSYSGTVHFTSTDAHAVLPGNSTLGNGVGNFHPEIETVGSQTITATDTVTTSITGTSNSIAVSGPASHLSVMAPPNATLGQAFHFDVTARDASNNVATGYSGTVHITSSDSQATLSADSILVNGVGTFLATLNTVGSEIITATDTVTASIMGTSSSIQVTASRFKSAGNMEAPRYLHTATLLSNGKVLNAGGNSGSVSLASVELFDPISESFTPAGNLGTPRDSHTATVLPNGSILIAGGQDGNGKVLMTAELFDPSTGSSTPTGNMTTWRRNHTATLLTNGKVLIAGGFDGAVALPTAELFDPSSGLFTPTGNMGTARQVPTATRLTNGKVLVAGGSGTATAELFNPSTGMFTPTGNMTAARFSQTATLLNDGTVLVVGGITADLYDPSSETFTATGSPTSLREWHTATLLKDEQCS